MNFKDIVNRDLVNLKNCDQEPIHVPGSIQPHGCLLAVNKQSLKIEFASENTNDVLGIDYQKMLDKSIQEIFQKGLDHIHEIVGIDGEVKETILESFGKTFIACIHCYNGYYILEFEKEVADSNPPDMLGLSQEFVGYIENTKSLRELSSNVAIGIKKVTGYDRVMIYLFDKDYNGEVIAEAKEDHLESFFGLHYPHTDIPKQARELYIKNQLRIITDVDYVPTAIYSYDTNTNTSLDLSYSILRSVSPIHCQYLRNIGVGGTLTISLLHRGKLWGLVACHHYSVKHLPFKVRMAAKLMGYFITSQIDARKEREEYEGVMKSEAAIRELLSAKYTDTQTFLNSVFSNELILKISNAVGASICIDGNVYSYGYTPAKEDVKRLCVYLSALSNNTSTATNNLKEIAPELKSIYKELPGVLHFSLDESAENSIIWYRSETVREVNWAGDPSKSIEYDKNGLSPRKSFALWKETVKEQSQPWLNPEISCAKNFLTLFQKELASLNLLEEEKKQRKLAHELSLTNAELENINWISSHDLQEPLRKIQMIGSILVNDQKNKDASVLKNVTKMSDLASRMQGLLQNILKYTRLNYSDEAFERINLQTLMSELILETEDALQEHHGKIVTGDLPVVFGVPFLIKQVFANLIYNSIKFREPSRSPQISILEISAQEAPFIEHAKDYFIIKYTDNGIGFKDEYNEKIFEIFSRLNEPGKYHGSGVGLALCRKIMTKHKGFIKAKGEEDNGATFYLYLPY